MPKNLGTTDRVIRFVFAAAVAVLIFSEVISGTWAIVLGTLAVVFLVTSLIGFCPLYVPFKLSTNREN